MFWPVFIKSDERCNVYRGGKNMNMLESISSYNFVEIDGYAYFSNLFYNAFFMVELKTGKATFLGCFEDENLAETNIHFFVMHKENQIYFFPRFGRYIHIYNLSDKTMQMIEIRRETDSFFYVDEIILNDRYIFFTTKQKNVSIKKLDLETYKMARADKQEIQGEYLSRNRNIIPESIVEKYQIKYGEVASCKQMPDGKWYFFKPVGRDILCFAEEADDLETIALTVVNGEEFKKHLIRVKQNLFQNKTFFWEFEGFKLKELMEVIMLSDRAESNDCQEGEKHNTGKLIWKEMIKV